MYKVSNGLSPTVFSNIFTQKNSHPYNLQLNSQFSRPLIRSLFYGTESKSYLGPVIWNIFFHYLLYLESGFLSVAYLTVANLARLGISVHCYVSVRCQYLVRLLSSPSAGLQVVTQSTHLSKDSYLQLVLNPHRSEIRSPK